MTTTLQLGNTAVAQVIDDPNASLAGGLLDSDRLGLEQSGAQIRVSLPELGNRTTTIVFPAEMPFDERLAAVRSAWPYHSDADGPEWAESDDAALAQVVAGMFTTDTHSCSVGRPTDWQED